MSIAPESAVSPMAQAPSDRPTTRLEQWAREGKALLFGDNRLDDYEKQILHGFMEQVMLRAQAAGGIGTGAQSSPEGAQQLAQTPMEQNSTGMQDYGDGQGEPTGQEY